jgi:hypothetical protein
MTQADPVPFGNLSMLLGSVVRHDDLLNSGQVIISLLIRRFAEQPPSRQARQEVMPAGLTFR